MPYQAFEIKEISKRDFSSYLFEYECAIILKVLRSKWLLDVCGNKKMSPQAPDSGAAVELNDKGHVSGHRI